MADISHLIQKTISHIKSHTNQQMHFIVVGAGGTGGYLIPNLTRQVALTNQRRAGNLDPHTITVIDADLIEDSNLVRQNFVASDVGKNKAQAMANRYGRAFKQPITYIDSYLSSPRQLADIVRNIRSPYPMNDPLIIVIDCTDNNKTRLLIHEGIHEHIDVETISLSSGNEDKAGQVVFATKKRSSNKINFDNLSRLSTPINSLNTPDFYEIFPNSPVDKLPDELSCAENAISAPQNIHTNMTAANILFGYVNKLLNDEPISELAIFFDISSFGQKIYRHTEKDLLDLLSLVPNNEAKARFLRGYDRDEDSLRPPTWREVEEAARLEKEAASTAAQVELDAILMSVV